MKIIDCRSIADEMLANAKKDIDLIREHRKTFTIGNDIYDSRITDPPSLGIVSIGEPDDAGKAYIKSKIKAAEKTGIDCHVLELDEDDDISEFIYDVNDNYNAVIVQSPSHLSHVEWVDVMSKVDPKKDADCLTPYNLGLIMQNYATILPATTTAVLAIIDKALEGESLMGKRVTVIGRSTIVGRPTVMALISRGATVTCCNSLTDPYDLHQACIHTDIIVSATGKPGLINPKYVNSNVIIIDVGITRTDSGLIGDCGPIDIWNDYYANWYDNNPNLKMTKVPGGVGLVTVAALMQNVARLYNMQSRWSNKPYHI